MSEWQPIETAPKDGTLVLLLDGRMVVAGCWNAAFNDGWCFWDGYGVSSDDDEANVVELNSWIPGFGPSHWMPLPSPPINTEEAA